MTALAQSGTRQTSFRWVIVALLFLITVFRSAPRSR
jgi:hypothetical protein